MSEAACGVSSLPLLRFAAQYFMNDNALLWMGVECCLAVDNFYPPLSTQDHYATPLYIWLLLIERLDNAAACGSPKGGRCPANCAYDRNASIRADDLPIFRY